MCGYCQEEHLLQCLGSARSEGRTLEELETEPPTPGIALDLLIQEGNEPDKFESFSSSNTHNALTFMCRLAADGRSRSPSIKHVAAWALWRLDTFIETVEIFKKTYAITGNDREWLPRMEVNHDWLRQLDQEIVELFEAFHIVKEHAPAEPRVHALSRIARIEWFPLSPGTFGRELWLQRRAMLAWFDSGGVKEILAGPPVRPQLLTYLLLRRRLANEDHQQVVDRLKLTRRLAAIVDLIKRRNIWTPVHNQAFAENI